MQYFRLLLIHCRYFHDPQPEYRVISDAVSIFLSEVARSLKCGVNRACSFSFSFRTDVFKCLFGGKGKDCPHKLGYFFMMKRTLMLPIFLLVGLCVMIC